MSVTYSSYPKATFNWSNTSNLYYVIISWTGNTTATSGSYSSGSIYSPTSTYTTGDLSFNTKYTFSLVPYNSNSVAGTTTSMTINTTPATNGIYATYSTSSTAQLQWSGSYSYVKVRRSHYRYVSGVLTQTGFGDLSAVAIANPYTDYDLSGNTTYVFYITPYISGVAQDDSPQVSVKTNVQAPKDVSVNSYDTSGIKLSFTTPKNTYSTSVYYTATAVDSCNNTVTTVGTKSPLWVVNLSGGTQYTCYIKVTLDSSSTLVATSASVVQTTSSSSSGTISSTVKFVVLSGTYTTGVSGGYTLVRFTGNSVMQPGSTISSVPTLIVAGGGGGGCNGSGLTGAAGGGGAGGLGVGTITFSNSTYYITVGAGGNGGTTSTDKGFTGGNSYIYGGTIYENSYGGGYGIMSYGTSGSGGSSGGDGQGGYAGTAMKGFSGSSSGASMVYYGYSGYSFNGGYNTYWGGGGGGAGGAGTLGTSSGTGKGSGYQWSINLNTYAAGGGTGGAASATANTGNGGDGNTQYSGVNGGNGGSGVVICAFTTSTTLLCVDDISGLDYAGFRLSFENGVSVNDVSSNNNSNDTVFSYLNTPTTTSTTSAVGSYSLNLSSNSTSGGIQTTAPLIYSSNLNLTLTSSTYITISFWAKIASASSTNNEIIDFFDGTAWSSTTGGYITCNAVNIYSRGTYTQTQSFTTIADNTWHHIVAIINFGTTGSDAITVYRDGSLVTNTLSSTSSTLYATASAAGITSIPYVNIGAQMNSRTYSTSTSNIAWATSGYIDDVRMYQYKLPYSHVMQLYKMASSSAKISSISGTSTSGTSTSGTSTSGTSVTLTVSTSGTSYVVVKNITNGSFSGPYSVSSGSNTITLSSLSAFTTYSFVAYPFDSNGYQGASSAIVSVTTSGLTFVDDVSGLILYYRFESTDLSSNTQYLYNYATGIYDASFGTGNSLSTTSYKVGTGSLSNPSSATGDGISIRNFSLTNGSFSCSYWWYHTSSTTGNPRIFQFNSGTTTYSNRAFYGSYVNMFCFDNLGGSNYWSNTSSTTIPVNTWNHMTITFDDYSNSLKYYLNGSLQYTNTFNVSLAGTCTKVSIFPSTYYIAGYLDDFRFYNQTVLSSSQISQIYNEASYSAITTKSSTSISTVDTSSVLISFAGTSTSYYVIYNQTSGTLYGQDYSITTSPYTINGLSSGTTYNFYVIPYDSSYRQGAPSQLLSATTSSYYSYWFYPTSNYYAKSIYRKNSVMSKSGQYMYYVATNNNRLYSSSTYGSTFTDLSSSMSPIYGTISCSSDGSGVFLNYNDASIYYSGNYGKTFKKLYTPGGVVAYISVINNGSKAYFTTGSWGGSNWALYSITPTGTVTTIYTIPYGGNSSISYMKSAISGDGSVIIVNGYQTLYISTNSGSSFASTLSLANQSAEISISNDGNCILVPNGTYLYISRNKGTNWSTYTSSMFTGTSGQSFGDESSGHAMSEDGSIMHITCNNYLFVSYNFGYNWSQVTPSVTPSVSTFKTHSCNYNGKYVLGYSITTGNVIVNDYFGYNSYQPITDLSCMIYYYPLNYTDLSYVSGTTYKVYDYYNLSYNASLSTSGLISTTSPAIGNGCFVSSGTGYLTLPSYTMTSTNIQNGYSVSVWAKTTSSATGTIFNIGMSQLYVFAGDMNANFGSLTPSIANSNGVTDGTWHHYVLTVTGASSTSSTCVARMYFDGVLKTTTSGTPWSSYSLPTTNTCYIGGSGTSYNLNGSIDDFRFYNTTLSYAQIYTLYNMKSSSASLNTYSISAASYDSSAVQLSWSGAGTSNTYTYITNYTSGQQYGPYTSSTTSKIINGLSSGTTYQFYLTPVDSTYNQGAESAIFSMTPSSSYYPIIWYKFKSSDINGSTLYNYGTSSYDTTISTTSIISSSQYKYNSSSLYVTSTYKLTGPSMTMPPSAGSFSISLWFKWGTTGFYDFMSFYSSSLSSSYYDNYAASLSTGNNVDYFRLVDATGNNYDANGFNDGSWHHCVYVVSANGSGGNTSGTGYVTFYKDGSLYGGPYSKTYYTTTTRQLVIGGNAGSTAFYINDYRYYNYALTAANVTSIYNGNSY